MNAIVRNLFLFLLLLPLAVGCGEAPAPEGAVNPAENATAPPETEAGQAPAEPAEPDESDAVIEPPAEEGLRIDKLEQLLGPKVLKDPWTGDLDGMIERRVIRVLTVYGLGRYFFDGPQERGITYETFKQFETQLNERLGKGHLKVYVVFIPVRRDELIPALIAGRGDIAAAGLTITPERDELIDFSDPASKEIQEILVTGPSAPPITSLDDLAGQTVHARASSSYHASLQALSQKLQEEGKAAIDIQPISELLEDEDLLEMVHSGLLRWAVVDNYKAEIWVDVFDKLVLHPELMLRSGGHIGYAFRENSPQLQAELNSFISSHRAGTAFGNILIKRYLKDFDWVANATEAKSMGRFADLAEIFRKYGEQYGMDYLMVAAQGFQESRLDQNTRSHAGAIGVMQLLPSTAADPNVGIPDISTAEPNIHAGIKYLDFIRDRYFSDPGLDRFNATLLSFAAYNAGPARVQGLREKARADGLDPNVWFSNVEVIAAREIGRETVQYVANIYKYYTAYRMSLEQQNARAEARNREGISQ